MGGFNNPVVGALNLIRKAIRSPNYVPGSSGWSINQDGSAEFSNLTARGTVTVQNGQGVFVYFGAPAAGTLIAALASANGTDPYGNTYMQGLYLAGYSSGGIANGISLQPKNVTVAGIPTTFTAGEIFTETFPTGENQTWITSPYDTGKGLNAATIELRGSSAANAGGCDITLDAFTTTIIGDATVTNGVLRADNIASGNVTITPVANTPTSVTVSGLSVTGSTFTGQATAVTTVIGSTVQGVSVSSVTATGLLVWVYRTNTTATGVHWLVIGK
jgi:hypothetical protein